MAENKIKPAIEAILFASGVPLEIKRISETLELPIDEVKLHLEKLIEEYKGSDRGLEIITINSSYQIATKKEFAGYIRTTMDMRRSVPISQASLEVLSVIAYNQPVTKAFVEQVRGVDCAGVIGSLVTKNLIEEKGRSDLPGRPILYGTTETFLRCFSLQSLEQLPELPKSEEILNAEEEISVSEDKKADEN